MSASVPVHWGSTVVTVNPDDVGQRSIVAHHAINLRDLSQKFCWSDFRRRVTAQQVSLSS